MLHGDITASGPADDQHATVICTYLSFQEIYWSNSSGGEEDVLSDEARRPPALSQPCDVSQFIRASKRGKKKKRSRGTTGHQTFKGNMQSGPKRVKKENVCVVISLCVSAVYVT